VARRGRVRLRERSAGDLIAVAERLIADGRTTARQLVIAGVSAGGGLIGAVLNARPELLAGAVLEVPFLDAVGTMADPNAPLTTIEYEEWGDPRVREDYDGAPALVPVYERGGAGLSAGAGGLSSLADGRVAYHEQARYVARLRARRARRAVPAADRAARRARRGVVAAGVGGDAGVHGGVRADAQRGGGVGLTPWISGPEMRLSSVG
jgi:protease II